MSHDAQLPLRSDRGATSLFLNRRPVDWRDKPPSRTAYSDWLADSLPACDELQPAEQSDPTEHELELADAAE